ncbi:MAG: hypothetical protein GF317_10770 [Candidatus Lokiarchaeota archaeon]|nr:hypothetical protein [Candidatus Lokiarchaeota archaeon]MBD3200144.1 hypothetical protein [Candidatus Lokiarchaeota archaeon]
MSIRATIGLDYSHNNKLTLEATSYSDFTQFLFTSGFKLGKIQAGFDSLNKLQKYDLIIISSPRNKKLSEKEIELLEEYVKTGGSLLLLSSGGGDFKNKTNLNELSRKFKVEFVSDEVYDSMQYINLQKRPLFSKFKAHTITKQVNRIVFSSACSLEIDDYIAKNEDIELDIILKTGLNAWHKVIDGDEWVEEDIPKKPMIAAIKYFQGKVVAVGNISLFSSLGREYGFYAQDNNVLIGNILTWLIEEGISEEKVLTINLNKELYQWSERTIDNDNWDNLSNLINVCLKYFKDNYKKIMNELQARVLEKKRKHEKAEEERKRNLEENILNLIPKRKKEDLVDIIKTLEDITGEKYEISIDLDEDEEITNNHESAQDK